MCELTKSLSDLVQQLESNKIKKSEVLEILENIINYYKNNKK